LLGVCSGFAFACAVLFSFFVFLTLNLAGLLGYSGFVHFGLLFLILRIPGFSPFSRISRAGWFLFCPVCRFVTVPTVLGGLAVRRHNNKKQQKKNWRTRYEQT
jgi:hypothetical protein